MSDVPRAAPQAHDQARASSPKLKAPLLVQQSVSNSPPQALLLFSEVTKPVLTYFYTPPRAGPTCPETSDLQPGLASDTRQDQYNGAAPSPHQTMPPA